MAGMDLLEPVSVYYLGSGRLGVPIVEALCRGPDLRLLGVATQPDRPAGRQRRLEPTDVARRCAELGVRAERVPSVNQESFLRRLSDLAPEIVVVASFGQIFRPPLLELPVWGCLNVHASLLPRHRGASPVQAAILAGDARTGVSFMRMDPGLDTGPVYRRVPTPIAPDEDAGRLEVRLGELAAAVLPQVLVDVVRGGLTPQPQAPEGVTYAPKLSKDDGRIDWSGNAERIARQVRAMLPWPRAFTWLPTASGPRRLQITAACVHPGESAAAPAGTLRVSPEGHLIASCGQGELALLRLVPEGRREMPAQDFIRGYGISRSTQFTAAAHES
ncbi:MAG: methionyl-tRNA formyltransferase [Lentisphaeria bacterium]|nr:methionyl-tRNA formyltransferase [Lentisphaeria bacterium]